MPESGLTPDRADWGPEELAKLCVEHAATEGFVLELKAETPVIPDEHHTWLHDHGTWGEINSLMRRLGDAGCSWVNLRFALDEGGEALVRYEANPPPLGEPLPEGRLPACNGGFDCQRLMSREEFNRRHPYPPAPPS